MVKKDDTFLKKLRETFAVEADEHLKAISAGLLELEKSPAAARQKEIIETVFRDAHSLKGAARAVNRADIVAICQPLENLFAALKSGTLVPAPQLFDVLHQTVNGLERLLPANGKKATADTSSLVDALVRRLEQMLAETGDEVRDREPEDRARGPVSPPGSRSPIPGTVRVATAKLDALFRQAEEMIAAKLAAEQRIADLREIGAILGDWKKTSEKIRSRLLAPRQSQDVPGMRETAMDIAKWQDDLDAEDALTRSLTDKLDTVSTAAAADRRELTKMIDNLLEEAKKLLMMPLSSLFEILPKVARDIAREQGKEVELVIEGDKIEIDRRIQEELKDPLIHLVRNCVDHGIEKPAERTRKHKPARGKIAITVFQPVTGRAEIVIADDGAGIDHTKVRAAAQKSGALSADELERLSEEEAAALIYRTGISTSPIVTDISGRGLGLAIVREKIERLNGTIALETQPDTGTTFRIVLPVTLSAFRGVVVRIADQLFVLPTINVEQVMKVKAEDIKTVENRETLRVNGNTLSLVRLVDVLELQRQPAAVKSGDYEQIAVLTSGGERIAFVVDEVLNEQEILLKGLGSQLKRIRNIAGSTALGTGILVPFLNVSDLMMSSIAATPFPAGAPAEQPVITQEKSVLVVEDSITARALLKNILEAAGYRVKTAVDGVDALTQLKTEPFDLVVSDIEMPRMDGFDLTLKIRADKKLAELPVVLVTALATREHRERGIDAGANAYIVKSDFDQTGLLEIIDRLV